MKRHDSDYWKKRISEQKSRGQSVAEYCQRHGLSHGTFLRWRKRLGVDSTHDLVEVSMAATARQGNESTAVMDLCIGSDIRIRFYAMPDTETVGGIAAALKAAK